MLVKSSFRIENAKAQQETTINTENSLQLYFLSITENSLQTKNQGVQIPL